MQEGGTFRAPALRAVERTGDRITLALVIPVALTLVAPASRAMDRRTNGQGKDLGDADDDGARNDNARDGDDPSRALLS